MLYQCEKFNKKCFTANGCLIKSTFQPMHVWRRNRYVQNAEFAGDRLNCVCKITNKVVILKPIIQEND